MIIQRRDTRPVCFLSHAWAEGGHSFAKDLQESLRAHDIECWVDEHKVRGGECLDHRIQHAVLSECNVFLVVLSGAWYGSDACRRELDYALHRRDTQGVQIIPILRDGESSIPDALSGLCYIDFRSTPAVSEPSSKLVHSILSAVLVYSLVTRLRGAPAQDRREAAQLLSTLANPYVAPILMDRLRKEPDSVARYWIAIGIGRTRDIRGWLALEKALEAECDAFARSGIEQALAMAQPPSGKPL